MSKKIAVPPYQPPPVVINMPSPLAPPPAFSPPINLHVHPVINAMPPIPKEVPQPILAVAPSWSQLAKTVFDPRELRNLSKTQKAYWCGRFVVASIAIYYMVKIARNYKKIYASACNQLNAFIDYLNRPKPPMEVVFKTPLETVLRTPEVVKVNLTPGSHPFPIDFRAGAATPIPSLNQMSASRASIKKEKEEDDEDDKDALGMIGEGVQRKPSGTASPKKESVVDKVIDSFPFTK